MLREAQALLGSHPELKTYFRSELEWLETRRAQWQRNSFRVGLMGVTSAGKSTLVNALLSTPLLPQAVRPSSNSLVLCEWGEKEQGIVHFSDARRKPKVVQGADIRKELSWYADERTNPNNREGVQEIELRSPRFLLGRDVSLIDTPGLDAYGHDEHEKLTLEVMLPTIDVVLFVTTCKANSDAKVSEYVSLARENGKPVIVVQNMIDGVFEKLGPHGEVLESRATMLDKLRRRLQMVLESAGASGVHINQVSAQWALDKGKRDASGLDGLLREVRRQLAALAPAVIEGRCGQLKRRLKKIIQSEQRAEDPAALRRQHQAELDQLRRQTSTRAGRFQALVSQLNDVRARARAQADELQRQSAGLGKRDVTQAHALKNALERWLRESPAALSQWNKDLMAQLQRDCRELDLNLGDLDLGSRLSRATSTVQLHVSEKTGTRRVQQSGWWGALKRKVDIFDNDWGYDEQAQSWSEITDLDAFRAGIKTVVDKELSQVDDFARQAQSRVVLVQQRMAAEAEQQEQAIRDKMASVTQLAQRIDVVQRLKALLGTEPRPARGAAQAAASSPRHQPPEDGVSAQPAGPSLSDVPAVALHLCQLSALIARRRFLNLRDKALGRAEGQAPASTGRVLITAFDESSVVDFVNRFWFDRLQGDDKHVEPFTKLAFQGDTIREMGIACFSGSDKDPRAQVKTFLSAPATLFVLLDIQQIGATEAHLARSQIPLQGKHGATVLVVQSIRELENSDATAEALHELKGLMARQRLRPVDILVNDDDVTHSQVAAWLLAPHTPGQTLTGETEFMRSLPGRARQRASATIRSWEELSA